MKTLRQYEKQLENEACRDAGITHNEYLSYYPPGSRQSEWMTGLEQQIQAGSTVVPLSVAIDYIKRCPPSQRLYRSTRFHKNSPGVWSHELTMAVIRRLKLHGNT